MRILNATQMREADRRTIEEIGIPSIVLMENAGRQVAVAIERKFPGLAGGRVAIVAGRGNNGGDGFVIGRTLHQRGADVTLYLAGTLADLKGDARTNAEIAGRLGLPIIEISDAGAWELHEAEIAGADLIVASGDCDAWRAAWASP